MQSRQCNVVSSFRILYLVEETQPVAPVVQVVNLELYLFESWVRALGGSDFDYICKNKKIKKGFNC